MAYITPPSTPEGRACRALLIPDSSDWLAIFGGALTELIYSYNWEQIDGISVDDAVQVAMQVINGFYEGCVSSGCAQPGGYPILRVRPDGHVEQLIGDAWVEPEGSAAFPPIPERTEPTPEERKCLAAANAANVLQIGYESLADSFAEGATQAEAIINLIAAFAVLWFWFAPILNGLVLLLAGFLELVINAFEYVTVDAWDSTFTDLIRCALYECATDTGDIVTFDFQCFLTNLNNKTIGGDWTEIRLRAAVQVTYLLYILGGADFLNQAGGTTAIETADCDDCIQNWCYTINFEDFSGGLTVEFGGTWVAGVGWKPTDVTAGNSYRDIELQLDLGALYAVSAIGMGFNYAQGSFPSGTFNAWGIWAGQTSPFDSSSHVINQSGTTDSPPERSLSLEPTADTRYTYFEIVSSTQTSPSFSGDATLKNLTIHGTGDAPTHLEADGWVAC